MSIIYTSYDGTIELLSGEFYDLVMAEGSKLVHLETAIALVERVMAEENYIAFTLAQKNTNYRFR